MCRLPAKNASAMVTPTGWRNVVNFVALDLRARGKGWGWQDTHWIHLIRFLADNGLALSLHAFTNHHLSNFHLATVHVRSTTIP